jgi:transcription antitermination factor NusG
MLCRTGAETSAAQRISQYYPEIEAIAPVKTLQEKRQGHWEQHEQIMLPGYLFLYSEQEMPFDLCAKVDNLYRALEYAKGMRILTGSDEEYAQWIYRHQGKIGTSKVAIQEGQSIQVIDGPLFDCLGTIIKLDKHKRRALVSFSFDGQKRIVSISAECVLPIESKDG